MTQWLDVLAALAEDPSLIPSTHTGQLTILPLAPTPKDLTPTSGLWRHCTHSAYSYLKTKDYKIEPGMVVQAFNPST